jgi:hypothetical protein
MEKLFYLAHVCDILWSIGLVFSIISIVVVVFLIISKYVDYHEYDDEWDLLTKWIKRMSVILIISILTIIFCPNKKTFLFMMGGKVVDELVDKTNIEELPNNTIELLNEYIKVETEKIKKDK